MPQVSLTEFVAAAPSGDRLLSFATDTGPALASSRDRAALIFAVKQRSLTKPLILMGATPADLWPFVRDDVIEPGQQMADRYWPGAVTFVLPASDRLPPAVNPADPTTIGLRIPDQAIARHLLAQTGVLATTSVNRSGEPPLLHLSDINAQFPQVTTLQPQEIERLERNGRDRPASGLPSTVIQWTSTGWKVLRQGSVEFEVKS